jgi:hypothetical protein
VNKKTNNLKDSATPSKTRTYVGLTNHQKKIADRKMKQMSEELFSAVEKKGKDKVLMRDLAAQIGMTPESLSSYRGGNFGRTFRNVLTLCNILGYRLKLEKKGAEQTSEQKAKLMQKPVEQFKRGDLSAEVDGDEAIVKIKDEFTIYDLPGISAIVKGFVGLKNYMTLNKGYGSVLAKVKEDWPFLDEKTAKSVAKDIWAKKKLTQGKKVAEVTK